MLDLTLGLVAARMVGPEIGAYMFAHEFVFFGVDLGMTTGTFNPRLDPVTLHIIKDAATADQASFEALAHRAISAAHGRFGLLPDTVSV